MPVLIVFWPFLRRQESRVSCENESLGFCVPPGSGDRIWMPALVGMTKHTRFFIELLAI